MMKFLVILFLTVSLFLPSVPAQAAPLTPSATSTFRLIAIYRTASGQDSGIGAGWQMQLLQNGVIKYQATSDSASQHYFYNLPYGLYEVNIPWYSGWRCHGWQTIDTPNELFVLRCVRI